MKEGRLQTSIESIEAEVHQIRKYFLKYTRQAFQIVSEMKDPFILDVGCGSRCSHNWVSKNWAGEE